MIKLLYDIYSVSTKGKSRREKIKLLDSESSSYALLQKNHISFASSDGVSYPDVVIDALGADSFVYIANIAALKSYLLIYINNEIVYSSVLQPKEIKSKLLLYKSRLKNNILYYSYDFDMANLVDNIEVKQLDYNLADEADQSAYCLKSVDKAKRQLQKPIYLTIKCVVAAIVVIGGYTMYQQYEARQALIHDMHITQKQIDLWKGYRHAVAGSAVNNELSKLFAAVETSSQLGNTAVKKFNYTNQQLQLVLANFNMPTMRLQDWAKQHQFTMGQIQPNEISFNKQLSVPVVHQQNQIRNADRLQAWFSDTLNSESTFITLTFNGQQKFSNYKQVNAHLQVQQMPESVLVSLFKKMHNYPIRLTNIQGYTTLGSFTGSIDLRLIGGL